MLEKMIQTHKKYEDEFTSKRVPKYLNRVRFLDDKDYNNKKSSIRNSIEINGDQNNKEVIETQPY